MNKTELIEAVAGKANVSKKDAEACLSAFVGVVTHALSGGDKVQWTGFGTFELRERAARKGVNPATGQQIDIAASNSPAFKPGKAFKDSFNK
ncbi:MAG: HU family DNA-binding protein [Eubacteriales bacterium]|nr:HU family DNA-binding protein [Eubacteriales bacterium]